MPIEDFLHESWYVTQADLELFLGPPALGFQI